MGRINIYKTELIEKKYLLLKTLTLNTRPYVIFTSPSAFQAFTKNYNPNYVQIISIGNTTSQYIMSNGYQVLLTSKMQSFESITEMVINPSV